MSQDQIQVENQCLGSGSDGSARFWLPESESAKRSKYQPKTEEKKTCLLLKPKYELLKKTDYRNFLISQRLIKV